MVNRPNFWHKGMEFKWYRGRYIEAHRDPEAEQREQQAQYQRRYRRTANGKETVKRVQEQYRLSDKGREAQKRYEQSEKGKAARKRAQERYRRGIT